MNKISNLGTLGGLAVIVLSIARWFFIYYDPSQMALGVSIGLIICGFSYIYDWMRIVIIDINKVNKRLDTFTDWWTKQEIS